MTVSTPTCTEVTTLRVLRDAGGRPRLRCHEGPYAARVVDVGSDDLEVVLLATSATLLGGDSVGLSVVVDAGLGLRLIDVAATVAYDGRGAPAAWSADLELGVDARLVWEAEPFIVADGAQVTRTTTARLAAGAGLSLTESFVLGRVGERGGTVVSTLSVDHEGLPLLRESATLSGVGEEQVFVRGEARVVTTRASFGSAPWATRADDDVEVVLAGPGRMARSFR